MTAAVPPSPWRAWTYLIGLSWQRHARAHIMIWVSLGLLALASLLVALNTRHDRWNRKHWRAPQRIGPTYTEILEVMDKSAALPWAGPSAGYIWAASGAMRAHVENAGGMWLFSNWVVFGLFTSFLLPLWTLSFATEGLGRERESRTLLWLLVRPLPRWSIYLGKYLAMLPWCLALNLGGLYLLCAFGGEPGKAAFGLYWKGAVMGTLALAALFQLLSAMFRRAGVVALLYAFFLETVAGNMPGHFKRLSLNFYVRCMMYDEAHLYEIQPERVWLVVPVSGPTALAVLAGATLVFLAVGMAVFSRKEYLDLS